LAQSASDARRAVAVQWIAQISRYSPYEDDGGTDSARRSWPGRVAALAWRPAVLLRLVGRRGHRCRSCRPWRGDRAREVAAAMHGLAAGRPTVDQIGRASCRERGEVWG